MIFLVNKTCWVLPSSMRVYDTSRRVWYICFLFTKFYFSLSPCKRLYLKDPSVAAAPAPSVLLEIPMSTKATVSRFNADGTLVATG